MVHPELSSKVEEFINREVFGGRPNDELLSRLSSIGSNTTVRVPSLYELPREELQYGLPWPRGPRIRAQTFTTLVQSQEPLHRSLPPATPQPHANDVFVVAHPELRYRVLTKSLKHWSVFCNGHYYHLKALSRSPEAPMGSSHAKMIAEKPTTQFEDVNFSNLDPSGHHALSDMSGMPLFAYHMGQTSYSPREIREIAVWIIGRLEQYGFLASECEHFVLCLLMRIVSRARVQRAFLGTAIQIALWDRSFGSAPSTTHDDRSTGWALVQPNDHVSSALRRIFTNWRVDSLIRHPWMLHTRGAQALLANIPLSPHLSPFSSHFFHLFGHQPFDPSREVLDHLWHQVPKQRNELASTSKSSPSGWRSEVARVEGFGVDDIQQAQRQDMPAAYLAPDSHGRVRRYHIGIVNLEPQGHVAVTLQHGSGKETTPFEAVYRHYEYDELPAAGVRLLHLRCLSADQSHAFALVLTPPQTKSLRFFRYHDLYRVYTTERTIRHIALRVCPQSHQYILSDCATYAFNCLSELLRDLGRQCPRARIETHLKYLALLNRVYDGRLGVLETIIRQKAQKYL